MTTIHSMLELAIELRDDGKLRDSINVLYKIVDEYTGGSGLHGIYGILGGIHFELGEKDEALRNYKKAAELNPSWETPSLGMYTTLFELKREEEALHELIRYLKIYPANAYKKILKILLEGLKVGYMTAYEEVIGHLARINGVSLSEGDEDVEEDDDLE